MIDTIVISDHPEQLVLCGPDQAPAAQDLPDGLTGDLSRMLTGALSTAHRSGHRRGPVTLVIPSLPGGTPALAGLPDWHATGIEADTGWHTVTRVGAGHTIRRVDLCVLDRISAGRNTLFPPGLPAAGIADRLRSYRDLTGQAWYGTAGLSGTSLLRTMVERTTRPDARPRWVLPDSYAETVMLAGIPAALDIVWGDQDAGGHRWDIRSQYLASAQAAVLGTGVPERTGPIPFDADRAGWWRIELPAGGPDPAGPPLWDADAVQDGTVWVTTPIAGWLRQQTGPLVVVDSLTSPTSHRWLRTWATTLRDAVYTVSGEPRYHQPELRMAIKATYAESIGIWARPGRRVYRPDWRDTIITLARLLFWRKVCAVREETGYWPVKIHRDSVWYDTAIVESWEEDHRHSPGLSWGQTIMGESPYIGRWRYEGHEAGKDRR